MLEGALTLTGFVGFYLSWATSVVLIEKANNR